MSNVIRLNPSKIRRHPYMSVEQVERRIEAMDAKIRARKVQTVLPIILAAMAALMVIGIAAVAEGQTQSCQACECVSCVSPEDPNRFDECDVVEEFRNGNLWKPEGDHSSAGVVLLRNAYQDDLQCETQKKDTKKWESLQFTGYANGNRQHHRLQSTGKDYKGIAQLGYVRCQRGDKVFCFKLQDRAGVRNE